MTLVSLTINRRRTPLRNATLVFVVIALVAAVFADFELIALKPWGELAKIFAGALTPKFLDAERLIEAAVTTLALALLGVMAAAMIGFALTFIYRHRAVRSVCAFLRNIHELFWALMLMQVFGLTAATGLLALVIPYSCIFAKIYSELLGETDPQPAAAIPGPVGGFTRFLFARLPDTMTQLGTYTAYRLECGIRSSTIMGFVGLPTLGFHLETAFSQGDYGGAWAILYLTYAVIATLRWWFRPRLLPIYIIAAMFILPLNSGIEMSHFIRFFTSDIVPAPLARGDGLEGFLPWITMMATEQIGPGLASTLILTQIALVLSGLVALIAVPLVSRQFGGPVSRIAGHLALVVTRSTPEYIIAFVLLLVWGPSMLPAVVALAIHNGAIVGHLTGRLADDLTLRPDAIGGFNRYTWEVLPRVYGQFLAFLFYRWEIIFRETAILGILGIHTLGFYADSAIAEFRLDRATLIIVVTGVCGMGIEAMSRRIRTRLKLTTSVEEAKES